MTREEFNSTQFGANMEISYKGNHYQLISVDFEEGLVGYDMGEEYSGDLCWARCESVEIVSGNN